MIYIYAILLVMLAMLMRHSTALLNVSSNVTDQVVREFVEICPYTQLCYSNASLTFKQKFGVRLEPCCKPCRCDDDCNLNCCPDKIENPRRQTVTAVCRSVSWNAYIMIVNCPDDFRNETMRSFCENEPSNTTDFSDISEIVPVTSNVSQRVYKNIQCALCNGEKKRNLDPWAVRVVCDQYDDFELNIIYIINNKTLCNLEFEPIVQTNALKECILWHVSTCNETGLWPEFDAVMEFACNSYISVYTSTVNTSKTFKNVHCFLCNGYDLANQECPVTEAVVDDSSFVAVINFHQYDNDLKVGDMTCASDEVFDPVKGHCIPLKCESGLILNNNNCFPMFNAFYKGDTRRCVTFQTTIILIPDDPDSTDILSMNGLVDSVDSKLDKIGEFLHLHHKFKSFIQLKKGMNDLIKDMKSQRRLIMLSDFDFICFSIQFATKYYTEDISELIKQIEQYVGLSIERYTTYFQDYNSYPIFYYNDEVTNKVLFELQLHVSLPELYIPALIHGNDDFDEKGRLPIMKYSYLDCYSVISYRFTFNTLCAKVKLALEDYNITFDHVNVFFPTFHSQLRRDIVSLSGDNIYIIMCYDVFLTLTKSFATSISSTKHMSCMLKCMLLLAWLLLNLHPV